MLIQVPGFTIRTPQGGEIERGLGLANENVLINGQPTDPFPDDGVRIMAYASNEYGETAYLATRVDGSLVRRYVSTE